jgi:hypothetical protein
VEYRLERSQITLVGGGGGAAAIVPWLARRMGMRFVLADNADVISAIGVALALVRETIERSMVAPSTDDLLRLRREAETAVARLGAAQGTIEVQLEIDAQRNIVRAIATGATELRTRADQAGERPAADLLQVAARSLGRTPDHVSEVSRTEAYHLYAASWEERTLLGLLRRPRQGLRVVDQDGVVRLQANRGAWLATTVSEAPGALRAFLEGHAHYGDGGKDIPDCFVLAGRKILDLSGLLSADQVVSLCVPDLEGMPGDAPVVVVGALRR